MSVFQSGVDHLWLGARVQAKPNRHLGRTSRKENLLERDDCLVSVFQIFSLRVSKVKIWLGSMICLELVSMITFVICGKYNGGCGGQSPTQ